MTALTGWTLVSSHHYDRLSRKAAAWIRGDPTMSADVLPNEIVAFLLRVLNDVENAGDKLTISGLRKPVDLQEEATSKSLSTTKEQTANPFVERIAAAMSRFRGGAPTRVVG
jgi:hypothetical protein